MRKIHSQQDVDQIASQALGAIKDLGLPLYPEIYELWYSYFAQDNPELCHAIDQCKRSEQAIEIEVCEDLYQRYISHEAEVNNVREAGSKIQTTVNTLNALVSDVQETTSQYNETLTGLDTHLQKEDWTPDEVKSVIKNISKDTKAILKKNKKLETELKKQAQSMLEMQRDLNRVRQEAMTDGLTKISNRKAFDTELEGCIKRYTSGDSQNGDMTTFSVILVDIDHFKSFNDNYGHQIGDQVLRLVAKTLVEGTKGRDFVARYGGEEFALILPETNQHAAQKLADTLRQAVANKQVINRNTGEKLGRITLSGGVTEFYNGDGEDSLIKRADTALYEAKEKGRNTICMAKVSVAR